MDDANQIEPPASFLAIYSDPGGRRLVEPAAFVIGRYELCEDLAQSLLGFAEALVAKTGGSRREVVQCLRDGLGQSDAPLPPRETDWVLRRVAELAGFEPDDAS